MWDERYKLAGYAYGTEPNDFLRENIAVLPKGKILCLAEGEGRNAVFLAKHGYQVTAVDSSIVGLQKAQNLAIENAVSIECVHADLCEFELGSQQWDGVVSIFCPLLTEQRVAVHTKVAQGLKSSGVFLTEAYTPKQVQFASGGGDCTDTMQSKTSLLREFPTLEFMYLLELEREVVEGSYHTGLASVVQAIGRKRY
ncbi:MAG: methyltransferase domain-containing protein [Paraglaciecola sp.]|uniref:class I SAM-dependent methyltransferase n=1 Tax=Paraglaciecola sp. TaxID=1920173 RepID=UPI003298CEDE